MKPIVIVGPTSSGKTSLSLSLADRIGNCDILVVDSKQVYRGQDIITGKDLPVNFQFSIFPSVRRAGSSQLSGYKKRDDDSIRLFGLDLVNPNEEWSVAQFLTFAKEVIERSQEGGRQLIIVGGTPQYLLSLFKQPESAHVPPNEILRRELESYSVEDLQKKVDDKKLMTMNESDRQNPRRLIRAIEIQASPNRENATETLLKSEDACWIGLELTKEKLEKRIKRRVINRFENGALGEYQSLAEKYPDWRLEAKAAIGYSELEQFDLERVARDELIELWTLHEVQYAKRQMQWWKRESQIEWFDALDPNLQELVFERVKS